MAYHNGAKIVTDGLVLALDAGNKKSYPGSGTTWYDLSGNGNNGTLVNGVSYGSVNGGFLDFDGTNDEVKNFPIQFPNVGSKSVFVWFNIDVTSRRGLAGTRPAVAAQGWTLTVNRSTAGNLTMFHTGGSTIERPAGIQVNRWYYAGFVYDSNAASAKLYLNGVQVGATATSFSNVTTSTFNGVVGNEMDGYTAEILNGKISNTVMYNRALTPQEILQNYNATKGRFGL